MSIAFIPNDPRSTTDLPPITITPTPNRPAARAGFNFQGAVAQKVYQPDTREFLFWQCREAVLRAIGTFESLAGNVSQWARSPNRSKLSVDPIFNGDPSMVGSRRLNAYYDGDGLRFFDFKVHAKPFFSGMSTDTVAHETGHALLDSIRPDLWGSVFPEAAAFHEATGDIMAMIVALRDAATRARLLTVTSDLSKPNFVEANSEYLSEGIRLQFGNVAPSQPRRALNQFKWQLPTTLPAGTFNDPPGKLTAEFHSFSRVFSGCFWDVLRNVFAVLGGGEPNLSRAVEVTAKTFLAAARAAVHTQRFFQEVGRQMVLVDQQNNNGQFREAIKAGFQRHNVALGTAAMLQPAAALAGDGVDISTGRLPKLAIADLKRRTGATRLSVVPHAVVGAEAPVARAQYKREVPLDTIHPKLKGVVAVSDESVLIGASGTRAAVLGAMPMADSADDEVQTFVRSLVDADQIQFEPLPTRRAAMGLVAAREAKTSDAPPVTHAVINDRGKKVLMRLRFFCQ